MKKLNVAILEDDIDLLKDLYSDLKSINLVEVLVKETTSQQFLNEVKGKSIDLLILDIDLQNDSKSGIDVANKLKLPVLFITGKTNDYVERIQSFNSDHTFPVHSLTKPVPFERLKKIIEKISLQLHQTLSSNWVHISVGREVIRINQNDITHIESISNNSNNKVIYFANSKPITVYDFSFLKMIEKGFREDLFIKSHQSFRVNMNHIYRIDFVAQTIHTVCMNNEGNKTEKQVLISDNFKPEIKRLFFKK